MCSTEDIARVKETLRMHRYEYRDQVGAGGYGTVFLVWSMKYNELFVAKRIPIKATDGITSEVESLMNLQHPNIINMYEYWVEDNVLYIILEYCPNGSLKDVLKATGPLTPQQLWQTCKDITAAIEFCHSNNIVHRDIKPANLLIDKYNRIKLCDFGLSAQGDALVNAQIRSPAYMSPEALSGRKNVDQFKCDIWALGVTFFELATGVLPWASRTFQDMRREILSGLQSHPKLRDYSLVKLLKQMMDLNPESRMCVSGFWHSAFYKSREDQAAKDVAKRASRQREMRGALGRQQSAVFSRSMDHFPSLGSFTKPSTKSSEPIQLAEMKHTKCAISFILGRSRTNFSVGMHTKAHSQSSCTDSQVSFVCC